METNDFLSLHVKELDSVSREFFNLYGTQKLLGRSFFEDIKTPPVQNLDLKIRNLFERMIWACGYENDPQGFFAAVLSAVELRQLPVRIGGIEIPVLYLYRILEVLFPGSRLHSVTSLEALEKISAVDPKDRSALQSVIDLYPVRLSDHVIRQSRVSGGVARQYLPLAGELDTSGRAITFDGHFKKRVVEQMYQNRVVFLLDMTCPVYCRFCFRKHKSTRKEKTPAKEDILAAAGHVKASPGIREILITGGEPLMNRGNLETALESLMAIDHVEVIRIATRSVAYYPELLQKDGHELLTYLIESGKRCSAKGKSLEIGLHFVHPDEVSVQSLGIISLLVQYGIRVYVQTPFLKGLNTEGRILFRLFTLLRQAGVKIYYIFAPCSPIHGTRDFWAPISKALEARAYLREHLSDRSLPKLCTATPLGKIEWHTSGFAVEKDTDDSRFTWIRTPYTRSYFQAFMEDIKDLPDMRENPEGTLDARFQVDMGDDSLYLGNREDLAKQNSVRLKAAGALPKAPSELLPGLVELIRAFIKSDSFFRPAIFKTPIPSFSRIHRTCVEIGPDAEEGAFEYIDQNLDITDVILIWQPQNDPDMQTAQRIAGRLKSIAHVFCMRLFCPEFMDRPECFTDEHINKMSQWCDFSIADPFRVELETWFLLPDDIRDIHGKTTARLAEKGVFVYANVPLLAGINDEPKAIVDLAGRLRQAGIEFHQVYASGLSIQDTFNRQPIDPQKVLDIASEVRRTCSGRQIPLYVRATPQGEKDFGLSDLLES